MSWDKERIAQLQLPDLADDDPHPRLLLARDYPGSSVGADRPRLLVHIYAGV